MEMEMVGMVERVERWVHAKEEEKRGDEQDGAEEVRGDGRSGPLVGYSPNRGGAAEAAAFWCFTALVEQILTGYFDPDDDQSAG